MTELPADLVELLDGTRLPDKVGTTLLVVSTGEDGWPRVATVSVGELLVTAPDALLVSLYASSRTTASIAGTGRFLLLAARKGGIVRARVEAVELEDAAAADAGRRTFAGRVVDVEIDAVPYARITHGIEFELLDGGEVLERWQRQLDELRAVAAR